MKQSSRLLSQILLLMLESMFNTCLIFCLLFCSDCGRPRVTCGHSVSPSGKCSPSAQRSHCQNWPRTRSLRTCSTGFTLMASTCCPQDPRLRCAPKKCLTWWCSAGPGSLMIGQGLQKSTSSCKTNVLDSQWINPYQTEKWFNWKKSCWKKLTAPI